MSLKIKQKHSKEIVALNTFEAVRLRPTMYLGQVSLVDDRLPIIEEGKIVQKDKTWSPGFMHLIIEILENSLDEAKRMSGKMVSIKIHINLDTNMIHIQDTGGGFHKAASKHKKTGKSVVRTAFEELHSGSNFVDVSTNILGTHGVGSSIVNILSQKFEVTTINETHIVNVKWEDFQLIEEKKELKRGNNKGIDEKSSGTEIKFIPSPEVFPNFKWDLELIQTYLSFKKFLIKEDPKIGKLKLEVTYCKEGQEYDLKLFDNFIPKDSIRIQDKSWGTIILWKAFEDSTSVSFINGSQSSGIHQKIINDWCNEHFKYNLAHHFFESLISLNVPSTLMRFADQNKTKYAAARYEIEPMLMPRFKSRLIGKIRGSNLESHVLKGIEERLYDQNIKKIKQSQRASKRKISEKYTAATKLKESLYVAEGQCLEESTEMKIIRDDIIKNVKIKDVRIGDMVFTHKNNIRPITYKNKSIKKISKIYYSGGILESSYKHEWFIYDNISNEFRFIKAQHLIPKQHKLVKNYLAFLESFDEVLSIKDSQDKWIIDNNRDEIWEITKNNNICCYSEDTNSFIMKNSDYISKGDIIARLNSGFN
jgi:DNA gyrase/topoisomerase IV subunit B